MLGDPELVHIKGNDQPVAARQLLGLPDRDRPAAGAESALVGRHWEMAAVEGLLERAIVGHGAVVTVVGSPGIGKSRLVREVSALAEARGVEVFWPSASPTPPRCPSMPWHGCCGRPPACEVWTVRPPEPKFGPGLPTPTPMTFCSSRTCWASPTPTWSCRRLIRMPGGGG